MAVVVGLALAVLAEGLSLHPALGLRVVVEGNCPSAAAVEALLQPMLPHGAHLEGLSAHIGPLDELLRVEVRSESGGLLTVRDLERRASCPALAAGAAVVIASAVASLPHTAPPVASPIASPVETLPPPPLPPPRYLWDVGVGAVLAMTSQALNGAATLALNFALPRRILDGKLGLRISATGIGMRRVPVSVDGSVQGSADFTRLSLMLAPRYRPLRERPLVEAYAGAAVAAVLVEGNGFVTNYRSQSADVGIAFGLRAGRALPRVALWAELGIVGWLRPQDIELAGMAPSTRLPPWDILLSAGLSFGRFRP